jgi:purine-binding chemotaxis protein CheW
MATSVMESQWGEASPSDARAAVQLVSFSLAGELYGVEVNKVREVVLFGDLLRVPEAPPYVRGMIPLRKSVVPVVDLRVCFGLPEAERASESRIVVVETRGVTFGILVDAVNELLRVPADDVRPPPLTTVTPGWEYVSGSVQLEYRLLSLLNVDRILDQETKQAITAAMKR